MAISWNIFACVFGGTLLAMSLSSIPSSAGGRVLLTEMGGSIAQRVVRDAYQSLERRVHL
jgi:hypothetical protein